jgi:hypothetical protein
MKNAKEFENKSQIQKVVMDMYKIHLHKCKIELLFLENLTINTLQLSYKMK